MERAVVILPSDAPESLGWPDIEVHRYRSTLDIPGILRGCSLPVILVHDRVAPEHAAVVVDAIRAHPQPVIAVSTAPWDGDTPDPIAGACRSIVAGFGYGAIERLLELLVS